MRCDTSQLSPRSQPRSLNLTTSPSALVCAITGSRRREFDPHGGWPSPGRRPASGPARLRGLPGGATLPLPAAAACPATVPALWPAFRSSALPTTNLSQCPSPTAAFGLLSPPTPSHSGPRLTPTAAQSTVLLPTVLLPTVLLPFTNCPTAQCPTALHRLSYCTTHNCQPPPISLEFYGASA